MISPAIREAWAARAHWEHGAIGEVYPHGVPCIVLEAVRNIDAGLNAGQVERIKEATKKRGDS